jgi:hypothetical protein
MKIHSKTKLLSATLFFWQIIDTQDTSLLCDNYIWLNLMQQNDV